MRRRKALVAILACTALIATACSSSGGGSGGPNEGGPAGGGPTGSTSSSSSSSSSSSGGGTGQQAEGGSFSIAIGEPHYLFPPANCYASECTSVIDMLWTGLVEMHNGKLVNRVAKSITSKDQIHWDITLKHGWKFANGDPVNADAFIRAWNYTAYGPHAQNTAGFFSRFAGFKAMQGKHPSAKKLSGLKKVNNYEFTVTLNAPFSQFPYMLLYTPAFAPVTEHCLNNISACNEKPIGNGPYEMKGKWQHNQKIVIAKNPNYKGKDAGNADTITFKIYQQMKTAYRDWQAGNVDIVEPVPSQVPQARQAAGSRIAKGKTSDFTYIGLPTYIGWLQNPKIRHALSMAINRKVIIKQLLAGQGVPAQSVVSPIVPGGGGEHCHGYCTYQPEKAKKLVKEAGGLPKTIPLWVNSGAGNTEWVQAVGNMWKQVFGVNFTIKQLQFPEYLDKLGNGKVTGPYRLAWIMDYPSMVDYLKPIWFTNAPSNYAQYSNKKFESLVRKGSASTSQQQAISYYTKAEELLLQDMPVIPMYYGKTLWVYSDHVDNVKFSALYRIKLGDVTVNQ